MKVYVFKIPHFSYGEIVKVLARDKNEAINLIIKNYEKNADKNSFKLTQYYDNCLEVVFEKPQIISISEY